MDSLSPSSYKLTWTDFEANIKSALFDIKREKDFSDVTLACEDRQVEAHKLILAANSTFFSRILKKFKHSHPLIYLKDIKFSVLEELMEFIYFGEVTLHQDNLKAFIDACKELGVKGIMENLSVNDNPNQQHHTAPPPMASSPQQSSARVQDNPRGGAPAGSSSYEDVAANMQNNNIGNEASLKEEPEVIKEEPELIPQKEDSGVAAEERRGQQPGHDDYQEQCSQICLNLIKSNFIG